MTRRLPPIDDRKSAIVDSAVAATVPPKPEPAAEPPIADINIDDLLGKNLLILYRETRNLLGASAQGKLSREDAMCVRDNIKLLKELKADELDLLENMTDEELLEALKKRVG